jgi:hypothetical protein
LLELFQAAPNQRQACALADHGESAGASNTGARTGNDNNLALQTCTHGDISLDECVRGCATFRSAAFEPSMIEITLATEALSHFFSTSLPGLPRMPSRIR